MSLYYQDESVTLYHGNAFELLEGFSPESVDAVMTDPPYTERTHSMAKTNKGKGHGTKALDFASISDEQLQAVLEASAEKSRGWVISTLDYRHAVKFDVEPPRGLKVLRVGVWVKTNPMPQISADRPAQGWEAIAYMHRDDVKPKWYGGGKAGNYVLPLAQGEEHPTSKPLPMLTDWMHKFTKPGQTVLDPFAGSGTTLRAAKDAGRKAIGFELSERYCEVMARRLGQEVLDLGALA